MHRSLVLVLLLAPGCTAADAPAVEEEPTPTPPPDCRAAEPRAFELDAWGGLAAYDLGGTGFFRVEEAGGRFWMVSPDGTPLLSQAVNSLTPTGDTDGETGRRPYADSVDALYADEAEWAAAVRDRLRAWGFHGAGAWLGSGELRGTLPEAPNLALSGTSWLDGDIPDAFDPEWASGVQQRAAERAGPRAEDPTVIGWFLDNELRWGFDWRGTEDLAELTWALGPDAPGRAELLSFLRTRHGEDFASFAAAWEVPAGGPSDWADLQAEDALPEDGGLEDRAAWAAHYADRWFSVTSAAVRDVDPNHLLLGVRWVGQTTPRPVVAASAPYLDVVSVNRYVLREGIEEVIQNREEFVRSGEALREFHELTGKPVLVSEFAFRARDAGLPNTAPPLQAVYDTQTERAAAFSQYAHEHLSAPWIVGLHWFKWSDQPPGGRFDGENSNWGLVGLDDLPYAELTEATAADGVAWGYSCWAGELD